MKEKIIIFFKIPLFAFLFLIWFVFIQVEYEIITKPELRNDVPLIKGVWAVLFIGAFLLILSAVIVLLLFSIKRKLPRLIKRKS